MPSALSLSVIRGEPNLILVRPRVSVPLISRPVVDYRRGGTTPYGVRVMHDAIKINGSMQHYSSDTRLVLVMSSLSIISVLE